jgi:cytosine/adenosine deaminase-related metal-dependent hydrolase
MNMGKLLIRRINTLVTMNDTLEVLHGVDVRINGKAIAQIGRGLEPLAGERVIEGQNLVVYPGFINTHHHLFQTFQRCVPLVQDAKLFDWLVGLYEIWRHLTPEAVQISAMVGLSELAMSGCTTVADHFYVFPEDQPSDLLDRTIDAARTLGVRFHPTRGSMSRGTSNGGLPPDSVVQTEEAIIQDSIRVIEEYHDPEPFSMCRLALAPCSPFSVTPELLSRSADLARKHKVRLHTHLAETADETDYCNHTLGMRPLAFMESVGWTGPDVWYAHGIHFNDAELELLAKTKTGVAHCPSSNLRLGSGIARVPEMLALDIPVGLAVDGSASNDCSNMLLELRMATLVHRIGTGVDRMPVMDALKLATKGSARVLGRDDLGTIEVGKAADLACFSLHDIGLAGAMHDPVAAPILSFGTGRTEYTIINGEVVVDEGRLKTVDLDELIEQANELAGDMVNLASLRTQKDYLSRK